MKRPLLLKRLNQSGLLHHMVPLLCIALVVIVGVGYEVYSHADSSVIGSAEILSNVTGQGTTWCLNDENGAVSANNPINTAKCNGTKSQRFVFTGGKLENTALGGSYCIAVHSTNVVLSYRAVLASCSSASVPTWAHSGGVFQSQTAIGTGVPGGQYACLAIPASSLGSQLVINSCNASLPAQQWKVGTYTVTTLPKHHYPDWIINSHAISLLSGVGASNNLIVSAFNTSQTYLIGDTTSAAGVPAAIPTATYYSYQAIELAFANKTLPGSYRAVMYDNENWSLTPTVEQQSPIHYEQLVASLLHEHGLTYVAAPGTDIVKATGQLVNNSIYDTYISRNIAGNTAKYADVIDIQAQGSETNQSAFTSFVNQAAKQARAAKSTIVVMVGLSTNPSGQQVTNQQLLNAYNSVRSTANGYWLNIPGTSTSCPDCGTPHPQVGYYLLQQIYGLN